jgi:hypothetical protein
MNPELCTGTDQGGHTQMAYDNIGFSPCGEYVSHVSNKNCNPLPINDGLIDKDNCTCKTDYCPCGDFVSHRIDEPCNANQ